jgi:hypothetical protein
VNGSGWMSSNRIARREFLQSVAAVGAGATLADLTRGQAEAPLKVAAVFTEFTYRMHAHVILENFLEPYYFNGRVTEPGCKIVSFYADQTPARDLSRLVAEHFKIPIYPTIDAACCLGGKELAVDAVLSIGEHGTYPVNEKGQHEYPRKRFFDEIVAVLRRSKRAVPIFNDKHLSYRWDWAKEMVATAKELSIPFMAGSSVPLAQRQPALEIPAGAKMVEAVATHGGNIDSYDFHGLEVLQSMVEARAGGETGVARVQYLAGAELLKAADAGRWSLGLLQAGLDAEPNRAAPSRDLRKIIEQTWGLLVQYRDGLRAMVIRMPGGGSHWHFACRVVGQEQPLATSFFVGPWNNRCLFKALSHAIQTHFRKRQMPYPVERTLLTTGLVAAGVESHANHDQPYETPHLATRYQPVDYRAMREMGETWKVLGTDPPEPRGIDRMGKSALDFPS